MSISYPLSLPSSPSTLRVELYTRSVVAVAESPFSLAQQVQEWPGMAWGATITFPPMTEDVAREWEAFLLKLNGRKGTFLLGDTLRKLPRGSVLGTPLVSGAAQTGQQIATDGWDADEAGVLLAGDYIQIGYRLYRVLNDVDADGSGGATIDIWPRLRESPSDNAQLITLNCKGLFRLSGNTNLLSSSDVTKLVEVGLECVEAV